MAEDRKVVGIIGSNVERAVAAAQRQQAPYRVAYARAHVAALIICGCRNVPLVIDTSELVRPVTCPLCRSLYYVTKVTYDAQAHYEKPENQQDDERHDPPVSITVSRVDPPMIAT